MSEPPDTAPPSPVVGLVGGLGPAATTLYYRMLLDGAKERALKLRLLIDHADVEQVLAHAAAGRSEELAVYLDTFLTELQAAGASRLAIGAVTPHLCVPRLSKRPGATFVDLVAALDVELRRRRLARVALIGTQAVVASNLFGRLPQAIPLHDPDLIARMHALYVSIVRTEVATQPVAEELRDIAAELVNGGRADGIVLAGTELSLIPHAAWGDLPIIGCAEVHAAAILDGVAAGS